MTKPRKGVPTLTQKRLLQESQSRCSFCDQTDVATFEYHHLDEDPLNNDFRNLIVVCSSCHTRITRGIISTAEVLTKKRELQWKGQQVTTEEAGVNVNIHGSSFVGDIAQNITKMTIKRIPPCCTSPRFHRCQHPHESLC